MKRSSRSKGLVSEQEVPDSELKSLDSDDIKILEDAGFKSEDTKNMSYEERKNLLTAISESSKKSKIFADKSPNAYQFSIEKNKLVRVRSAIKSNLRKLRLSKETSCEDMKAQTPIKDINIGGDTSCKVFSKNEELVLSPLKHFLVATSDLIDLDSKWDGKRRILKNHLILNSPDFLSGERARKTKSESNVRLNAREKKVAINKTVASTIFEEDEEMLSDKHGSKAKEKDVEHDKRSKRKTSENAIQSSVYDSCIKREDQKQNIKKFNLLKSQKRGEHFQEENLQNTPRKKIRMNKNSNALLMHNMSVNFAQDRDQLDGTLNLSIKEERNDFVYSGNKSNENNYLLKGMEESILSPKTSMKRAIQRIIGNKCTLGISHYCIRKNVSNKAVALGTETLADSHTTHHKEATSQEQSPICIEDDVEVDEDETQPMKYMIVNQLINKISDDKIQFEDYRPNSTKLSGSSKQPEEVLIPSPQGSFEVRQPDTDEDESPRRSPCFTQDCKSPTVVPESQSIQSSGASFVIASDVHDLDEELQPKLYTRPEPILNMKEAQHQINLVRTYPKQVQTTTSSLWSSLCVARNRENPECLAKVFELIYDTYFRRLKRAQQNMKGKLASWGKPVTIGAHVDGCLIAIDKKTNLFRNRKGNNGKTTSTVNDSDHPDSNSLNSRAHAEERALKELGMRTGDVRRGSQIFEKKIQPEKNKTRKRTSNVVAEDDKKLMFLLEFDEQSGNNNDSDYKPTQKHSRKQGNSKKKSKKCTVDNRETASKASQNKRQKTADEYGNDSESDNEYKTIPAKQLKLSLKAVPEREGRQEKEHATTKYSWLDDEPTTSSNPESHSGGFQRYTCFNTDSVNRKENIAGRSPTVGIDLTNDDSSNDKKDKEFSEENCSDEDYAEIKINTPAASDMISSQRTSPGLNSQSSNSLLDVNGDLYSTQIAHNKKRGMVRQFPPLHTELEGFTSREPTINITSQENSERDLKRTDGCGTEKRCLRKRIREETENFDYAPKDEEHKAELNNLNLFLYEHERNDGSKKRKEVKRCPKAKTKVIKKNLTAASSSKAYQEPLSQHHTQDSLPHNEGSLKSEKELKTMFIEAISSSSSKTAAPWKEIQNHPPAFTSDEAQPCPVCGEKFSMELLETHASSCGEDVKTICVHCQCEFPVDCIKDHQIKCSKIAKVGTPKRLTRSLKAGTSQMLKVERVTKSSNKSEKWEELLVEK